MTSKDHSGGQERVSRRGDEADQAPAELETTDAAERKAALDQDVDSLLDEIDGVLEQNSEEFVRSFVQKGGE